MIECIGEAAIVAKAARDHYAIERLESVPVIRTYSDLIGKPLPSTARISSMLTITGAANVFAVVIDNNGCMIRAVLLPKELHRKAMGQEL